MRAVALICEFNPFHTGHEYCINAAKRKCDCDTAIGVMSGFFVQRGEPAVIAPKYRAAAAINCGLDAVIQMPTAFSCASGNIFAEGAVGILAKIPDVHYLAMGAEDDGEILIQIAKAQSCGDKRFTENLKNALSLGLPYAAALTQATVEQLKGLIPQTTLAAILKKPNNLLAIEYIKAIDKTGANIKPVFIKRKGNGYNNGSAEGEYISATAARDLMDKKDYERLSPYIPEIFMPVLISERENHPVDYAAYNAVIINALRFADISSAPDSGEGLDIKLKKAAQQFCDFNVILNACKSKRYTMSRIKRLCLQSMLGITRENVSKMQFLTGKLIAIKKERKNIIKQLGGVAVKNADFAASGELIKPDEAAGSIYNLITHRGGNAFYGEKLITV